MRSFLNLLALLLCGGFAHQAIAHDGVSLLAITHLLLHFWPLFSLIVLAVLVYFVIRSKQS